MSYFSSYNREFREESGIDYRLPPTGTNPFLTGVQKRGRTLLEKCIDHICSLPVSERIEIFSLIKTLSGFCNLCKPTYVWLKDHDYLTPEMLKTGLPGDNQLLSLWFEEHQRHKSVFSLVKQSRLSGYPSVAVYDSFKDKLESHFEPVLKPSSKSLKMGSPLKIDRNNNFGHPRSIFEQPPSGDSSDDGVSPPVSSSSHHSFGKVLSRLRHKKENGLRDSFSQGLEHLAEHRMLSLFKSKNKQPFFHKIGAKMFKKKEGKSVVVEKLHRTSPTERKTISTKVSPPTKVSPRTKLSPIAKVSPRTKAFPTKVSSPTKVSPLAKVSPRTKAIPTKVSPLAQPSLLSMPSLLGNAADFGRETGFTGDEILERFIARKALSCKDPPTSTGISTLSDKGAESDKRSTIVMESSMSVGDVCVDTDRVESIEEASKALHELEEGSIMADELQSDETSSGSQKKVPDAEEVETLIECESGSDSKLFTNGLVADVKEVSASEIDQLVKPLTAAYDDSTGVSVQVGPACSEPEDTVIPVTVTEAREVDQLADAQTSLRPADPLRKPFIDPVAGLDSNKIQDTGDVSLLSVGPNTDFDFDMSETMKWMFNPSSHRKRPRRKANKKRRSKKDKSVAGKPSLDVVVAAGQMATVGSIDEQNPSLESDGQPVTEHEGHGAQQELSSTPEEPHSNSYDFDQLGAGSIHLPESAEVVSIPSAFSDELCKSTAATELSDNSPIAAGGNMDLRDPIVSSEDCCKITIVLPGSFATDVKLKDQIVQLLTCISEACQVETSGFKSPFSL